MAQRGGVVVAAAMVAWLRPASAEPKPVAVDIKPFKDKLTVLADADGGIYVAVHEVAGQSRVFYGAAKTRTLYAQVVIGGTSDGDAWNITTWSPRLKDLHPGMLQRHADGTYERYCWGESDAALTELTGDKARAVLDHYDFLSSATIHRPHLLARDDAGVYYYVDTLAAEYGGNGYRVFIGKRGALKQVPLSDVAVDSAGEVFSTKTGDIRIVADSSPEQPSRKRVAFIRGDKKVELVWLDLDLSSRLIFRDLAIYDFLGTLCENV
jgi:hypothetical protein